MLCPVWSDAGDRFVSRDRALIALLPARLDLFDLLVREFAAQLGVLCPLHHMNPVILLRLGLLNRVQGRNQSEHEAGDRTRD